MICSLCQEEMMPAKDAKNGTPVLFCPKCDMPEPRKKPPRRRNR